MFLSFFLSKINFNQFYYALAVSFTMKNRDDGTESTVDHTFWFFVHFNEQLPLILKRVEL